MNAELYNLKLFVLSPPAKKSCLQPSDTIKGSHQIIIFM